MWYVYINIFSVFFLFYILDFTPLLKLWPKQKGGEPYVQSLNNYKYSMSWLWRWQRWYFFYLRKHMGGPGGVVVEAVTSQQQGSTSESSLWLFFSFFFFSLGLCGIILASSHRSQPRMLVKLVVWSWLQVWVCTFVCFCVAPDSRLFSMRPTCCSMTC